MDESRVNLEADAGLERVRPLKEVKEVKEVKEDQNWIETPRD